MDQVPYESGPDDEPVVFVVDDDDSFRNALVNLLRSVGMQVESFASAQSLMTAQWPDAPACIVLDVRLKADSGLAVQNELARAGVELPIIFMTGYGDIPMTLSSREQQVMTLVARGLLNKQIAAELGLSEITVKVHRGQAMKKMGARTLADLLHQAVMLKIREEHA